MLTTTDAILDGALVLEQPAPGHGYRFNVDSIHLARFAAQAHPIDAMADLGAGVGIVGLCIGRFAQVSHTTFVEVEPSLCELIARNLKRAGRETHATVVQSDVAAWEPASPVDLVVANPPYFRPGTGRVPPNPRKALARQGNVEPFLRAGRACLRDNASRVCLSYPAHALVDLVEAASRNELLLERVAFVFPSAEQPARIALAQFAKATVRVVARVERIVEQ